MKLGGRPARQSGPKRVRPLPSPRIHPWARRCESTSITSGGPPHTFYQARRRSLSRPIASVTFSRLLNALRRKYPSPDAPNPLPGVPTTLHWLRSWSKNCQLVVPAGVLSQTYGALTPPYTFMPSAVGLSQMTRALVMWGSIGALIGVRPWGVKIAAAPACVMYETPLNFVVCRRFQSL